MSRDYAFTLHLRVTDRTALHAAAMTRAVADGMSRGDAYRVLGTKRRPDVPACLTMLFDPGLSPDGTEILDSTAEGADE